MKVTSMEEIYEFKLSRNEADYLKQLVSHDESLIRLMKFHDGERSAKLFIRLTRSQATQLREFLMSRMDLVGFDENYEPNEEGRMLEDLIDRFFSR